MESKNNLSKKDNKNEVNSGRRKVVKQMVVGTGVLAGYSLIPEKWIIPKIGIVNLPAHAQTSIEEIVISVNDPCTVTWVDGYQDSDSVVVDIEGYVFPATEGMIATIVVTPNPYDADGIVTIVTTTNANGEFSTTATLTTTSGIGTVYVTTTVTGADGSASCNVDVPQRWGSDPEPEEPEPEEPEYSPEDA